MQQDPEPATRVPGPAAGRTIETIRSRPMPVDEFPVLKKWEAYLKFGFTEACEKPWPNFLERERVRA